jgi:hypothetical protein
MGLDVFGLWEGKTRRDRMERVGCGAMRGGRPGRGAPGAPAERW